MTETAPRGRRTADDGIEQLIEQRAKEAQERELWDATARTYAGEVRDATGVDRALLQHGAPTRTSCTRAQNEGDKPTYRR